MKMKTRKNHGNIRLDIGILYRQSTLIFPGYNHESGFAKHLYGENIWYWNGRNSHFVHRATWRMHIIDCGTRHMLGWDSTLLTWTGVESSSGRQHWSFQSSAQWLHSLHEKINFCSIMIFKHSLRYWSAVFTFKILQVEKYYYK